jgi:hypothetical protein
MHKLLVLALVLLVLLVGLPVAMGMGDMAQCPSCTGNDSPAALAMCLAILSFFVLVASRHGSRVSPRRQVVRLLLLADPLDRPPQLA